MPAGCLAVGISLFSLYLLGELQFAFVCFLLGNVYEAFEHWKRLLNLLCRSEAAMVKHHTLYISLISILYHQLGEIPADFFVDIVSQDNFLTSTLQVSKLWVTHVWVTGRHPCESTSWASPSFLLLFHDSNISWVYFLTLRCFLVLYLLLCCKHLCATDAFSGLILGT